MSYPRYGALNDKKHTLFEPMSHTKCHKSKDTIGLGYGVDDSLPIYEEESHTNSDSYNEIQPIATTIIEDDFIPSTSILWGEDVSNDNTTEASTSRQLEFDEFDIENHNRKCIRGNISHLLACSQIYESN